MNVYANIPAELQALPQWCVWRYAVRNGKPTKIPYNVYGIECEVDDPRTFSTFAAVCAAQGFEGIGFVLTANDPYCFIDLDAPKEHVKDVASYQAAQMRIAAAFDTYQEISPSGNGLHIICKASVIKGKNNRERGVEVYSQLRYMTMTGNVYKAAPIAEYQELVTTLWVELGGKEEQPDDGFNRAQVYDDRDIYDRAQCAKNGALFVDLWHGRWQGKFKSQSEADQALCNLIAFYTQNRDQISRLFHISALGQRDKAKRPDYLKDTLDKALDQAIDVLDFTLLVQRCQRVVMEKRSESAELERKRIDGINRALQEHHARNEALATQQINEQRENSPDAIAAPLADSNEFESPPGLLGEIAQFMFAQSPYPLPRTALTAAIAFLSAICGRAYNINGVGCNLYLLLVAPTGTGKEAMSSGISKLSLALGEIIPGSKSYFGLDQIASGQALYVAMKERKAALSIQNEFGLELQNLTHPRAPSPIKFLKKAYLDLFTKSGEGNTLGASAFADKTKNTEPIQSPSLTILGETAPPHLYDAMNETMMADGLIPRFLLIECDNGSEVYNTWAHTQRVPQHLLEKIAALMASVVKMDHLNRAVHIKMDAEAQQLAEQYRANTKRTIESQSHESGRQVWSRAHVKALKLAGLVALGCSPWEPVISADHFRWAVSLVNDGTTRLMRRFESGAMGEGDARQTADAKKFLLRYIQENGYTLPKHAFNEQWHQSRIISYSYFRSNVIQTAAFRLGIGGASQSFVRCLKSLCDEGAIQELTADASAKYGTSGKLYALRDVSIIR